jgi:hypothetical protein
VGGDFVLYGREELHMTMKRIGPGLTPLGCEVDMRDRDELVGPADNDPDALVAEGDDNGVHEFARLCAAKRAEQLAHLRAELAAGQPVTEDDVAVAHRHAGEAHIRARRALAAAERTSAGRSGA